MKATLFYVINRLINMVSKLLPPALIIRSCERSKNWLQLKYRSAHTLKRVTMKNPVKKRLLWMLYQSLPPGTTFITTFLFGIKMICRDDWHLYNLFSYGTLDNNEITLINEELSGGSVFVDVGANAGFYTLMASKKVGPKGLVLSIEPSSREFDRLKQNVKLNKAENIRLLNYACSDTTGTRDLLVAIEPHAGHNTFGKLIHKFDELAYKEPVRAEPLDKILESERLSKVDFIKTDTEGHELAVLKGSETILKKHHPTILLEMSEPLLQSQKTSGGELMKFLIERGYTLYRFCETTGTPTQEVTTQDLLHSFNMIAKRKTN